MNKIIEYGGIEAIPLYNCSAKSPEKWTEEFGMRRPILGSLSILYGVIVQILFIPCLLVMRSKNLWKFSCYKIMFFMGCVDILAIAINSLITGALAIQGAVFCTYPRLIYIWGLLGLGFWTSSCLANWILLLNRLLNITNPTLADRLFMGRRLILILLLPVVYGSYFVLFTPTCAFSSRYYTWFYDPFIFPNRTAEYINIPHGINNMAVTFGTMFFYAYITFAICKITKEGGGTKVTSQSNMIFYQSVIICLFNQFASSVYVVMNFIVVPEWLIMMAHIAWQIDHGFPVFVYLTMNESIRKKLFKKLTGKSDSSVVQTVPIQSTIKS